MFIVLNKPTNLNNFNNNIKKGPWLVWFYADWCGHCTNMKSEWEKLESKCKTNNKLNIARVNDEMKDKLHNNIGNDVMGFPTIRLYNNGKLDNEYKGERDNNSLLEFLLNRIKTLKKKGDNTNIKNSIKKSYNKLLSSKNKNKSSKSKSKNKNKSSKSKNKNKSSKSKNKNKSSKSKNKSGGFIRDKSVQHLRIGN